MCATVSNLYNLFFDILLTQHFSILLTTEIFKPLLFSSHLTQLHIKADRILTAVCRLLYFALLWYYMNSLLTVLEVKYSCSRFLADSIAITLSFPYCVNIVVYAFEHLSVKFFLMFVVVGLFAKSSMFLLV